MNAFLSGFKGYTTTTASTNTSTSTAATSPINIATSSLGNTTASTLAQLEALAVNGNKNILALKNGSLTIDSCGVNGLLLTGVRTVIVENGDLIVRCNTGYGSSDTTSSWAWIVK